LHYRYDPQHVPIDAEVAKVGLRQGLVEELLRLPASEHAWQVSRRDSGVVAENTPLEVSFVVEVGSTDIRAAEAVVATRNPASLLESILLGMERPQTGEPCRPSMVVFDDLKAMELSKPHLAQVGVQVQYCGLLQDLETAWKRMRFLNRDNANPN